MAGIAVDKTLTDSVRIRMVSRKNWGFGNIRQRGKTWWIYYSHRGRMHHESSRSTKRSDAERLLKKRLAEIQRGETTVREDATTVDALLDNLLRDYRVNNKSIKWAEIVVQRHLRPFFGYHRASTVGSSLIDQYVDSRKAKQIRNGTINRELALLRSAYNMGRKLDPPIVQKAPRIPKLKEDPARKGFFEANTFKAVRKNLPPEIQDIATFAQQTGCRKGEILMIRWPQVDFEAQSVRLESGETKNDEPRILPMTRAIFEMLNRLKRERDQNWPHSQWVFSRQGERIRDFKGAWAAACIKTGLVTADGRPEKLFHDLRRTGVRNLIRAGVSEKVAMRISGHKTRSVFDRYHIVDERDLRDAARRLDEFQGDE